MNKIKRSIIFLIVALGVAGCNSSQSSPDKEVIMKVVNSFNAAFSAEDAEGVGMLLSNDPSFVFFGTGANEIQTSSQQFLDKHQAEDWALLDEIGFGPIEHLNVQSSPELAVVIYQTSLNFKIDGEQTSLPVRLVLTLVNENGIWRIRQGLASQIAQQA